LRGSRINGIRVYNASELPGLIARHGVERVLLAMQRIGAAKFNGALVMFAGVLPMVGASFLYFKIYVFNLFVLIVFLGIANSLVLLPVLLSWIGPESFSEHAGDTVHKLGPGQAYATDEEQGLATGVPKAASAPGGVQMPRRG